MYELHRLRITGPLDVFETPVDVIRCCLESHGIEPDLTRLYSLEDGRYRRKCIDKLTECKPVKVSSKKDQGKAVRYINSHTTFQNEEIIEKSLEHLVKWERNTPQNISEFGPITEMTPTSVDITMLYKICRQKSLRTYPDMKFGDLLRLYRLSITPVDKLRDILIDQIHVSQPTELIDMVYSRGYNGNENLYQLYIQNRSQVNLHDPLHVRFPATCHEAILMAAFNFKRDISMSSDPLKEYAVLMKNPSYFPLDNYLIHMQTNDKYALNLEQRFNPNLPGYVYHPEDIIKMATEEGWTGTDKTPLEFLQSNYMDRTFFAYKKGPMVAIEPENQELIIECQPLSETPTSSIVLYGSRTNKNSMTAFSWSELTNTFENYREFRNPASDPPDVFPDHVVRKLVILARKPCADEMISKGRKRLISVVDRIFLEKKFLNERIKNIQARFPVYRSHVIDILKKLYDISIIMREGTESSQDRAAIEIFNMLSDDEFSKSDILNLPLVIYYPRSGTYSTSESAYEGYTIKGRLMIVQEGESTKAVSSCMRLSSNWFLSTVYYYQDAFNIPKSFDIMDLVHIS